MAHPGRKPDDDGAMRADAAWHTALGRYIELARHGASSATLRAAAAAVHRAALARGRFRPTAGSSAR